jgi:hypothetical protein
MQILRIDIFAIHKSSTSLLLYFHISNFPVNASSYTAPSGSLNLPMGRQRFLPKVQFLIDLTNQLQNRRCGIWCKAEMSHYSQLFSDNSPIAVPLSGPSADGKRGCRSRRCLTGKAISCWGLNRQCRIHEFHCIKSLLHVPGCLSPWKRVSPIQRARPCYEKLKTFYALCSGTPNAI